MMAGICFGANYSILHLDIVDIPSKPCLTCTKQWCINQNLAICAGASLGDTDPDTATGKEGDVEARCFRAYIDTLCMQFSLLTILPCWQNEIHHETNWSSLSFSWLCLGCYWVLGLKGG